MRSRSLHTVLLEHVPAPVRSQLEALEGLEVLLQARFEAGRAAWPGVTVSAEAWATHLARHLSSRPGKTLEVLHDDFYLAVALMLAEPGALQTFTRVYLPRLRALIESRPALPTLVADEVLSTVEDRLLVSGPSGTRIAHYSGRGSLARFLRAAVVNQLMNRLRTADGAPLTDAMASALADPGLSPELAALARDSRTVFARALQTAFRSLAPRQRLLLRMHTFENATINDIGRMYQVHKVTAFRWLEEARAQLQATTCAVLRDDHQLRESELKSFLRQLPSAMELSLKTMFQSAEKQ